ncbi:MAG: hypothetical protein WDZ88_01345 [Candidatus Paceibacterota bacterium]
MSIITLATFITLSLFGSSTSDFVINHDTSVTEASYIERTRLKERTAEELKKETLEALFTEFKDVPSMIAVARCESSFRHYNPDGTVLRGRVDSRDIGLMQINEFYHGEKASELGIDIMSLEGNMKYARYLYENQGLSPWGASKMCWEKYI